MGNNIKQFNKKEKKENVLRKKTNINIDNISLNNSINKNKNKYIINYNDYIKYYYTLHEKICYNYGEISKDKFNYHFNIITDFINNINENELKIKVKLGNNNKKELVKSLNVFLNLEKDNILSYKKIIKQNTKQRNFFYKDLNIWLKALDPLIYNKISFFVSNYMFCLNEYGKLENKGIIQNTILYRGTKLKYMDLLLYKNNINQIIILPFFVSTSLSLEIAEEFSQIFLYTKEERKNREEFSVIFEIRIKNSINCFPVAFDIHEISKFKNEKEVLIQPFTFYKIIKIDIDTELYLANIILEIINKCDILEKSIKNQKKIKYNKEKNIIEVI